MDETDKINKLLDTPASGVWRVENLIQKWRDCEHRANEYCPEFRNLVDAMRSIVALAEDSEMGVERIYTTSDDFRERIFALAPGTQIRASYPDGENNTVVTGSIVSDGDHMEVAGGFWLCSRSNTASGLACVDVIPHLTPAPWRVNELHADDFLEWRTSSGALMAARVGLDESDVEVLGMSERQSMDDFLVLLDETANPNTFEVTKA